MASIVDNVINLVN